ncbi:roundabout homolog 4 isoform X2 [Sphaerodactylus townsendi]|uniref:roundabout homolog 4 isoform X2 n=1 Tax=Sphaerodactylus townsendi TaxID=933632 RepID=UPI00202644A9|nr:roundabout homolog 4 isoform X2 [Sphaerodactylus townsendi]
MSDVHIVLQRLLVWAAFLLLEGSRSRSEEFVPQIIDHPSDLVVAQNQPATLNCRATGNPAPTIEWYRNGELVKTTEDDATSQPTLLPDGSLFFLQFSQKKGKSDEGVYNCVARNNLGTATSKNASLHAAALRDDFRLHPRDSVVTSGEQLLLECIPPKGHPEPKISWKKNGIPINEESGHYEVSGAKLLVAHALKSDSGAYVCLATNPVGERESRAALVSVLEKPVFTRRPSDVVAKLGSTVQFVCGVHGDPVSTVRWHKEDGELPTGRYDISQENTLQIHHLTVSDAGKYVCIAYNQVGIIFAKASLTVQDLLDTGQQEPDWPKGALKVLADIRVYLANVTAVPSTPAAHLHWKVIPTSQHIEGYLVFYRVLLPVSTHWAEWNVPGDQRTIVPALERGYKYEFKVRPYAGKLHGSDSNTRHLWIPEEVPSAPPQSISISMSQDGNVSGIVHWEPPPHDTQNGIITGYQVWFLGNETYQGSNRTIDGKTHHLEVTGLGYGLKHCVRVAAINGAGIGVASNPVCSVLEPTVGKMATVPDFLSASYILEVVRQPVFIASVGSALWIMLMVLAVYVCQQQARQHNKRRQYGLGEGLYRNASDDTIIKHRVDSSDSPWLSNSWKSTSGSKNYSTSSSLSSQLLWTEPKDNQDSHKSSVSFDKQSQGSQMQAAPLVPDSSSSSLYGALYVDLPARDLKTFYSAPLPHLSSPSLPSMELVQPSDQRLLPLCSQNLRIDNTKIRGSVRQGKRASPSSPNLILQASWEKNSKKELQQVHSTPATPSGFSADWSNLGSRISSSSSGKHHRIPGETKRVLKSLSSPKFLQGGASQNAAVLLPPPPPIPPDFQVSQDHSTQQECTCTCYREAPAASVPQQQDEDSPQTAKGSPRESQTCPTLPYNRLSTASISASLNDDKETVLTPDEVAEYLELSEEAGCPRQQSSGSSIQPWALSAPLTYGYICGQLASELLETEGAGEDEDTTLQEGGCHPTKFFQSFCRTPSSSLSEDEASLGGSLLNGWGSVSEDNGTSTRCSLVSSSDGSFLLDANFAQALAVAVDSFCFGLAQREADKALTDFLPSTSPPDGIRHLHAATEILEDAQQKPRPQTLPVWEWSTDWVNDMEAKYMQPVENWSSTSQFGGRKAELEETQKFTFPFQGANGACKSDSIGYPDGAVGASQNTGSGDSAVPKRGEETVVGKPAIQKQGPESSP